MYTKLSAYMTPRELKAKEIERKVRELNEEYIRLQNSKPIGEYKVVQITTPKQDYDVLKAEISEFISRYQK